jgi:hypothetical protein
LSDVTNGRLGLFVQHGVPAARPSRLHVCVVVEKDDLCWLDVEHAPSAELLKIAVLIAGRSPATKSRMVTLSVPQ